jgi:hypothetical protein
MHANGRTPLDRHGLLFPFETLDRDRKDGFRAMPPVRPRVNRPALQG